MWTLVHSPGYGYGLLKVIDGTTPFIGQSRHNAFFVDSLSELHHIGPDESHQTTFFNWLELADATILLEFHTDSCPIQHLQSHYPELYL